VVYIDYRREDLLHSERACLACSYLTLASRVFGISGRSDRHVPRKVDGVFETHSRARFEVGGDEQWILRKLLHPIDEDYRFINLSTKKDDTSNLVIFDV